MAININATSDYADIFSAWEKLVESDIEDISLTLTFPTKYGKIRRANLSGHIRGNFTSKSDLEAEFKKKIPKQLWSHFSFHKRSLKLVSPYKPLSKEFKAETSFKGSCHYAEKPIGKNGFEKIEKHLLATCKSSKFGRLEFNPLGGKILRPSRAISYPHRNCLYILALFTYVTGETSVRLENFNVASFRKELEPLFSGRHYVNYPDLDLPKDWAKRYYSESLNRLIKVKKKYDPENTFDYGEHSLSSIT